MGQQNSNLKNKIKSLEKDFVQQAGQNDDLQDEIREFENKLKEVQEQRESLQRPYNELAQSLLAALEELTTGRASWDQTMVSHQQKEAKSAVEIEKIRYI